MSTLATEDKMNEIIDRLAGEIKSTMQARGGEWAFIGMMRRGDILARRLADMIEPDYYGTLDITLYRDDLSEIGPNAVVQATDIPFNIDNVNILLVDDVLMTGRSVRSALQSLIDFGRPACVQLAVLVDRGGRELPIAPDYVGMRTLLEVDELIEVELKPHDENDHILISERKAQRQTS